MEVVVLNDFCFINGGAAQVAISSARELARRGVPVTFFGAVGPVAPELIHPNIRCVCLEKRDILHNPNRLQAFAEGIYNRAVHQALRRLLHGKDPTKTVVHVHGFVKALSPFAFKYALDRKFPVVHTLHDYFMACPNGGFIVHPQSAICHREPLSLSCLTCPCDSRSYAHKLWRVARTAVQNKIWSLDRRLRFAIYPSALTRNILERYLPGLQSGRLILYPVDVSPEPPAEPSQSERFLFIGRISREKGVLLLAEAARAADVPVTFIGDGDETLKASIRQINPRAELIGWLPRDAIGERLRRCRALVMPSLWYETLGLVAIEAMARGVPVIVPDHSAARDYVEDGVTGLHFSVSAGDLAAKIRILKSDPVLAAQMGRAAYEHYWRDPWTVAKHVDQLQTLYADMLVPAAAATR